MELPLYKAFTEEQRKNFGPQKKRKEVHTEKHVYVTPFMYDNVRVSDFYEIDPTKGIEFKADTGYLTIEEDMPIVGVTVVGSGCYYGGYNICEWWDDHETIDTMKNQLVKRQRINGLNGTHPSIFSQLLLGTFPGLTFRDVNLDINGPVECLEKHSDGYYTGYHMGFYENTAQFVTGPPYPQKVTLRCGCDLPEVPGCPDFQPKADYAIRVVELTIINKED